MNDSLNNDSLALDSEISQVLSWEIQKSNWDGNQTYNLWEEPTRAHINALLATSSKRLHIEFLFSIPSNFTNDVIYLLTVQKKISFQKSI
jgi:hypothetical protein